MKKTVLVVLLVISLMAGQKAGEAWAMMGMMCHDHDHSKDQTHEKHQTKNTKPQDTKQQDTSKKVEKGHDHGDTNNTSEEGGVKDGDTDK
jgi:hypothetical protein